MQQWFFDFLSSTKAFTLAKLLPAIILLVVGLFAIRIITRILSAALGKTKLEPTAIKLVRSLLKTAMLILLFLCVASALGIDITGIVALASVLTLAISLSVQNALANVIGGFTLLYTRPFVAGDYVDIANQSGTVKDIGLTYTTLATPDNKLISLPNSAVVATEIINYSTTGKRRLDITVYCDYATPVGDVVEALLQAARLPAVLEDPAPFAGAKNYNEGTVEYTLQVWIETEQYWPAKYTINQNIQTIFREKGLSLACPHLNVHLDK